MQSTNGNNGITLQGKTVLITGANRGIGKSILEAALAEGAKKVYAAVRKPESVKELVEKYGAGRVVALAVDLSKPETISAAAKVAQDVEVVVNNGGVLTTTGPTDADVAENLAFEFQVNVYGLLHMAREFGPVLAKNGGGAFAQLNSVVSMKSFANVATYSASKAAAYSLTQALRETWKAQGTLVVSVHPGPIETDMAVQAGFGGMGEGPESVSKALVAALKAGEFHVFPDAMARQIGGAYEGFAKGVVEASMGEG